MTSHRDPQRDASASARWKIDPALVVTLIFTVVSAMLTQPFWSFGELDDLAAPAARGTPPPVLRVASDHSITIEGEAVSLEDVRHRIETILTERSVRVVSFRADATTQYGYASRVMEQVRRGGGDPLPSANP